MNNYKAYFAKLAVYEKLWLQQNPKLTNESGIYVFTREEDGIRYAYIGQATRVLGRLANHLMGYQHIDLSLKKHGMYSETNPTGWQVEQFDYPADLLDEKERAFIREYAGKGFQLRNKDLGGTGRPGSYSIYDRDVRGYQKGRQQGRREALKQIKHLFDLYLEATVKVGGKRAQTALNKFCGYLDEVDDPVPLPVVPEYEEDGYYGDGE